MAARSAPGRILKTLLLISLTVLLLGSLFNRWITVEPDPASAPSNPAEDFDRQFKAAVQLMQQGKNQQALDIWQRLATQHGEIAQVHVNMGFSLYDLGLYTAARDAFIRAMEINDFQANAYYGLAICSEKLGDLEGALGAMRSYIHLAKGEQQADFVRKARSAIWEWETELAERRRGITENSGAASEPSKIPTPQ